MTFESTPRVEVRLRGDLIAWLTTVTPGGRPAPRPVWFLWDGCVITVYSLNGGAKLRHIEANDHVTLHFNSTPDGSEVVVISGRAEIVPDAPPASTQPGFLDKYSQRISDMGRTPEWYDGSYGVALHIVPDGVWTIPPEAGRATK